MAYYLVEDQKTEWWKSSNDQEAKLLIADFHFNIFNMFVAYLLDKDRKTGRLEKLQFMNCIQ